MPQVDLTQFSPIVSGNIESRTAGVGVKVTLVRADADGNPVTVAQAATTTAADGSWQVSLAPHAVGDDRDEIDVDYSHNGAPSPSHQVILTGNGGNPFTESGWTGWTALDNGSFLTNDPSLGGPSLSMSPCFQTGVLVGTFNGAALVGPNGESDDRHLQHADRHRHAAAAAQRRRRATSSPTARMTTGRSRPRRAHAQRRRRPGQADRSGRRGRRRLAVHQPDGVLHAERLPHVQRPISRARA